MASPHEAATAAGGRAVEAGGNALDAALTASAVLSVVYPHMCSPGGDLFALVREPDGRVTVINSSGAAPARADPEALRRAGSQMPVAGPHTITVPGVVAGWAALADMGARRGLAAALRPAIELARAGVPVSRSLAASLARVGDLLAEDPGMAEVFRPGGRLLELGDPLRQPALAVSLEVLAERGPAALYGGDLGDRLVRGLGQLGSPLSLEDLASHRVERRPPLTGRYRDVEVLTAPPNSQGFVLLEILAAAERLGGEEGGEALDPLGPEAPVLAEVFRLASVDRDRLLADPRRVPVPIEEVLTAAHIEELCARARASLGAPRPSGSRRDPPRGDTAAVVVADSDGWAASVIQSIFHEFGAGILEPTTGIICHNRGSLFSLDPRSPNVLEGGKRPAHTLMPVLVSRRGELAAVAGTMGARAQPQILAQVLIRLLALGWEPAAAVDAARWIVGGQETGGSPDEVLIEGRAAAALGPRFRAAGFSVTPLPDRDEEVGHAQLIRVQGGSLEAATDPRADGAAAAL